MFNLFGKSKEGFLFSYAKKGTCGVMSLRGITPVGVKFMISLFECIVSSCNVSFHRVDAK
jgi:hypothetical protein